MSLANNPSVRCYPNRHAPDGSQFSVASETGMMRRAPCSSPISPRAGYDQVKSAQKTVSQTRKTLKNGINSTTTDANSFAFIDDSSRYIEIYRRSKWTHLTSAQQLLPQRLPRNACDAGISLPKVTCVAPIPGAAAMYRQPPPAEPTGNQWNPNPNTNHYLNINPNSNHQLQQEPILHPAHDINLSPICQKLNSRVEPLPRKYSAATIIRPFPTADRAEMAANIPQHWRYTKTKKLRLRVSTAEYVDFIGDIDRFDHTRYGSRSDPLSSAHARLSPPSE